jgi:hypothetical protein
MKAIFEGRKSASPYIEMVWRGQVDDNYAPTCPADSHWNLLLIKKSATKFKMMVEGPTTQAVFKYEPEGYEFLVIKFKLGVFLPYLSLTNLVNGKLLLPDGVNQSFWLNGSSWQFPDFENAESFVERLKREGVLVFDPQVQAVLQEQPQAVSARTIRRHFLQTTGLTPKALQQIERAQQAATLLERGHSILDVVDQTGYADQPHLTRSLKRFYGLTPYQLGQASSAASLSS